MGGIGGFNVDFDMDEILRLQEEEARKQQEAALTAAGNNFAGLAADYPDIFGGPGPGPGAQPVVDSSTIGGAADLSGIDWEGLAAEWQAAQTDPVADEMNLMGDLMGDPALGYSMDPSGYRVDADGYIVGPEGDVTNYTPWQVSQQDPAGFMEDYRFKDERPAMRQEAYDQALADGFTTEEINEFLGNVGTEDWFNYLQGQEDVNALYGDDIVDALTRIEETGTATLPWVDSPEFAAKYGSIDDPVTETLQCGEGEHEENGVCVPNTPGLVCGVGEHEENGQCVPDTVVEDPSGCDPGYQRNASGQCVLIAQITDADTCGVGQMRDASGQCVDIPPKGVPTYVAAQVDEINIINARLKSITDAHKKLLNSGIGEIDAIEEALTLAESEIYEAQYGVVGPDGEVLTPGEMDRLLTTFENRRKTTKSNRTTDRAEILSIMTDEGVPAGLAKSELDMIQAIHGDSIDAQYDYIESLWRIGKLSHDERTSMIGNMMASYKLQLRDTVVEMLMAEEVTTADAVAGAQQDALRSRNMANMFDNATEDEVYALMSSGMTDLLQFPESKEIGMIEAGEWAGYTKGQKANVLTTAGYTQNADGTFVAPAADAADDAGLKVPIPLGTLSELGMTAEAAREAGYTLSNIQYDPAQPGRILDANVTAMGTASDYGTIAGERRLGEASDLAYTGLITEGEWAGYTQAQKTVALADDEDPTGMITTGDWAGVTYGDKARALNAQGIDPATGDPYVDVANEDKKYRMNASELTDRGLFLEDFEVFGGSTDGGRTGVPEFVMISVEEFADLTGEYMFPASPDADPEWMTALFPSGVKTADVPGLPFDVKNGEYQMNAEALAVFGPLQEAVNAERAETAATFAGKTIVDILQESGHGMYSRTQQAVNTLMSKDMSGTKTKWRDAGLSETALWLYTVEQAASHDVEYAQVWANYTGVNAIVNAVTDTSGRVTTPAQTISPDPEYIR